MAYDLNHVTIKGRIVREDPALRYGQSGTAVCGFSIVTRGAKRGEQDGHFFEVVAFAKTAEFVAANFPKGSDIIIEGRLTQDAWTDKQSGQKRSKVVINAQNVYFYGYKDRPEDGGASEGGEAQAGGEAAEGAEDDIPF